MTVLEVLAGWIVLLALATGLGTLVHRLLRAGPAEGLERAWVGWAALIATSEVWHLFLAIDMRFVAVMSVPAGAGLVLAARNRQPTDRIARVAAISTGVLAIGLALFALKPASNPDDGVYYVQAVRWLEQFRAVPGLANLNERLGFNDAYFNFVALCDAGPMRLHGQHLANSFTVLLLLGASLDGLIRFLGWRRPVARHAVLAAFLLPPLFDLALARISSPSADAVVFTFGAALLLRALEASGHPGDAKSIPGLIAIDALLCSVALTIKPVMLFTAVPAATLLGLARVRASAKGKRLKLASIALAMGAMVGLPWIAHGLITSGYPFYPFTLGGLAVDWRLPAPVAHREAAYAWAFARLNASRLTFKPRLAGTWGWVPYWLRNKLLDNRAFFVPMALGLGTFVVAGVVAVWRRLWPRRNAGFAGAVILGLALWFFLAPAERFAGPLFWAFAAAGMLLAGEVLGIRSRLSARQLASALLVVSIGGAFAGTPLGIHVPATLPAFPTSVRYRYRGRRGEQIISAKGACFEAICPFDFDGTVAWRHPGRAIDGFRPTGHPDDR